MLRTDGGAELTGGATVDDAWLTSVIDGAARFIGSAIADGQLMTDIMPTRRKNNFRLLKWWTPKAGYMAS